MKRFIFVLLLQWPLLLLFSQDEICSRTVDQRSLFEAALTGQPCQIKKTIGSQLFRDSWFTGDIILTSGDTVRDKQIGYNGYQDELIWRMLNMSLTRVDKKQVDRFILYSNNKQPLIFRHLHGTIPGNRQIDFFAQILVEDTISLYVTRNIQLVDKAEQEAGGAIIYIGRIEPAPPVYYIGLPHNEFLVMRYLKKKLLYDTFSKNKEALRTLMIQHHQTLRKENDLLQIVQLLNKYDVIK
jgi:hypothetical protein